MGVILHLFASVLSGDVWGNRMMARGWRPPGEPDDEENFEVPQNCPRGQQSLTSRYEL